MLVLSALYSLPCSLCFLNPLFSGVQLVQPQALWHTLAALAWTPQASASTVLGCVLPCLSCVIWSDLGAASTPLAHLGSMGAPGVLWI